MATQEGLAYCGLGPVVQQVLLVLGPRLQRDETPFYNRAPEERHVYFEPVPPGRPRPARVL